MRFMWRALESLMVVWAVITVAFFALRLGRVDPLAALTAQGLATQEQIQEMRGALGLDQPLGTQYAGYFTGVVRGDLGRSIFSGQSVTEMIGAAAGYTVPLAVVAWLLSVIFGVGMGAIASRYDANAEAEQGIGRAVSGLLAVGASTPVAWSGLMILWVSVPLVGLVATGPLREGIQLFLPAAALTLTVGSSIGRAAETSIRQSRSELFNLAMRAHGFPHGLQADVHLLRAAIAPILTMAGMEAAFLLGGTMVTEVVFARPGLGRILVDAVLRGDYPVVQALLGLAALGYTLFGMIAEIASATLDPRVREAS